MVNRDCKNLKIDDYKNQAENLPEKESLLVHASSFVARGKGILIMAPSGVGKTTQMLLWKEILKDEFEIINDDKPILKIDGENILIESSPICGKEGFRSEKRAILYAVCLLDGSCDFKKPSISKIDSKSAALEILKQVYVPEDKQMLDRTIELVNKIFANVPIYILKRNKTLECAKIAIDTILENED